VIRLMLMFSVLACNSEQRSERARPITPATAPTHAASRGDHARVSLAHRSDPNLDRARIVRMARTSIGRVHVDGQLAICDAEITAP
jgi:hypothetical protein